MTTQVTPADLESLIAAATAVGTACGFPQTLGYELGRRYARVFKSSGSSRSVYCFVDLQNGDLLKARSWKAPAQGARGNLYAERITCLGPFGVA